MAPARTLALGLAALAAGGAPPSAYAATPPPEWPVIDQYVEMIPAAEGPSAPRAEVERRPLPADLAREVREEAGEDAEALTEIATSSRYGAPQQPAPARGPDAPAPSGPSGSAAEPAAAALEAGGAATIPGDSRLVVLMLAMAASVMALGAYELVRRRRGS